nr:PHD finger-like domain-containing protein 5B [Ipomoea batatas]
MSLVTAERAARWKRVSRRDKQPASYWIRGFTKVEHYGVVVCLKRQELATGNGVPPPRSVSPNGGWRDGSLLDMKQPGIAIGRLCEKCDGKCVICDSYVRPCTLVRVCDECNYGSFQGRCVICGGVGISDAYYCKECTQQEKDRDGCPKIVNLGSAKTDLFYERKKYGFKKR